METVKAPTVATEQAMEVVTGQDMVKGTAVAMAPGMAHRAPRLRPFKAQALPLVLVHLELVELVVTTALSGLSILRRTRRWLPTIISSSSSLLTREMHLLLRHQVPLLLRREDTML